MDGKRQGEVNGWMKSWNNGSNSASASVGDGIYLRVCLAFESSTPVETAHRQHE